MIQKNVNLLPFNTMGVDVTAYSYLALTHIDQVENLKGLSEPYLFLGGGSNILFTRDFEGIVIHNQLKGIKIIKEDQQSILIRAYAGENWHSFVQYSLQHGYYGLECLAYIPGTVGTAPVQNIGAYGVEVKEQINAVHTYNIDTGELASYAASECFFDYRNSIFKRELSNHLVLSVDFQLSKVSCEYKTFYPALQQQLNLSNILNPTPKDIFNAVVAIRQSKLPEISDIGSAGSFFKNPIVEESHYQKILERFPQLIAYPYAHNLVKLPAGQLIDLLGFKGSYHNQVGMYEKQALILVNLGGATGEELYQFSRFIKQKVIEAFDVTLEAEVVII